jgi:para-nitrobenzyl esterase
LQHPAKDQEVAIVTNQSRRRFLCTSAAIAGAMQSEFLLGKLWAADANYVVAETSDGKVRGVSVDGVKVFKGIPYGASTAVKNRFMPPAPVQKWTGVRDALEFGQTAPQFHTSAGGGPRNLPAEGEDCLVLNVFTPELGHGKRPVLMWLHGGGFQQGTASEPLYEGVNLARVHDVVLVSINHRLNLFGSTYLGEVAGSEFATSGNVGMQDIVASLNWVKNNIERFGGDPNMVTIFGQSGGGRKVATLMAMPSAKGLFHRAVIESGALLRLPGLEDAVVQTDLLLKELNIDRKQARSLQDVPMKNLLDANAIVARKVKKREPGQSDNSPVVDGRGIPSYPWDPGAPPLSANIPLMIGWARTEETLFDRPTPEKMALDEKGLRERVKARLEVADPEPVIAAFRETYPNNSPWDTYILIASNHPRGVYTEELGKRRVLQAGAPTWMYRVDWETPEGGGHMHSPHAVELPFVFNNVKTSGALISKMPAAYAMEDKISSTWVAFARTGNPNNAKIPEWPTYSEANRETLLFNNECSVVNDPQRLARQAMEKVLNLD